MKSVEWMPFLGDDFWESERVAAMDDSAALLYQWLIWRQFKHESLPSPAVLRTLPHRWRRNWNKVWPQVAACFDVGDDGRLRNAVCARHRDGMLERVENAREKSLKGVAARAAKRTPAQPQEGSSAQPQVNHGHNPGSTTGQPLNGTERNGTGKTLPTEVPREARSVAESKRTERGLTHQAFVDWWTAAFEKTTGTRYGFDGKKDGAAVKAILDLAKGSLEEAKNRALVLLNAAPGWIDDGGRDLCTLRSQWNRLASMGTGRTSGSKQLAIQDAMRVPQSSGLLDMPTARRA